MKEVSDIMASRRTNNVLLYDPVALSDRFEDLRKGDGTERVTFRQLSSGIKAKTGVYISAQQLSKYENADLKECMNINNLIAIANYYEVPIDYLIGESRSMSKNITDQYTSKKFGLSDKAMETLKKYQDFSKSKKTQIKDFDQSYSNNLHLINLLLATEKKYHILSCIAGYLFGRYKNKDAENSSTIELHNEATGKNQRVKCDLIKNLFLAELQASIITLHNELEKKEHNADN